MPEYIARLSCFKNNEAIFDVPSVIRRSVTADIVRTGKTINDYYAGIFSHIRSSERYQNARSNWQNAIEAYEQFALTGNMQRLIEDANRESTEYQNALFFIAAKSRIWNCGEFADFARITIYQRNVLKQGYLAATVTLNNPKIPEQEQYRNHDHAFVLIMDRDKNPVFVIDLWYSLVSGEPFFGPVTQYIEMLQQAPDGHYIRSDIVSAHIMQISSSSLQKASGASSDGSKYHRFGPKFS